MLKMPTIHATPPVPSTGQWQQTATPLDSYGQPDHTTPTNLIWHGNQTSAAPYFQEAEVQPDPLLQKPILPPSPFSHLFGFMGKVACTLLLGSFLALSGCKRLDKSTNTETTNASAMRTLSDDLLFIGKSRTVRLRPKRELSKRLLKKLQGQAYNRAEKLIANDVREKVKAQYPNDCHFGKFTFGFKLAWEHHRYSQETVRVLKNGTRLVRIVCKTTWKTGWCKRKYKGNRARGLRGSRIQYPAPNPALR